MDYKNEIKTYIRMEIDVLMQLDVDAINEAMNLLSETLKAEKNVYIFGNGGSAATASHFANDFNKGVSAYTEKKFRFVCLNDNVATITAIANDISYDEIYSHQLRGRLKQGDIVIAISGSGNSENIIKACDYAKEQGNSIIGITGFDGGKLRQLSEVSLHVPINDMQVTEDVHMVFDHLMMWVFQMQHKEK